MSGIDPRALQEGVCGEEIVLAGKEFICVSDVAGHVAQDCKMPSGPYLYKRVAKARQHFYIRKYRD